MFRKLNQISKNNSKSALKKCLIMEMFMELSVLLPYWSQSLDWIYPLRLPHRSPRNSCTIDNLQGVVPANYMRMYNMSA